MGVGDQTTVTDDLDSDLMDGDIYPSPSATDPKAPGSHSDSAEFDMIIIDNPQVCHGEPGGSCPSRHPVIVQPHVPRLRKASMPTPPIAVPGRDFIAIADAILQTTVATNVRLPSPGLSAEDMMHIDPPVAQEAGLEPIKDLPVQTRTEQDQSGVLSNPASVTPWSWLNWDNDLQLDSARVETPSNDINRDAVANHNDQTRSRKNDQQQVQSINLWQSHAADLFGTVSRVLKSFDGPEHKILLLDLPVTRDVDLIGFWSQYFEKFHEVAAPLALGLHLDRLLISLVSSPFQFYTGLQQRLESAIRYYSVSLLQSEPVIAPKTAARSIIFECLPGFASFSQLYVGIPTPSATPDSTKRSPRAMTDLEAGLG